MTEEGIFIRLARHGGAVDFDPYTADLRLLLRPVNLPGDRSSFPGTASPRIKTVASVGLVQVDLAGHGFQRRGL